MWLRWLSLFCLLLVAGTLSARTFRVIPGRSRVVSPDFNFATPVKQSQEPVVTQQAAKDSWLMSPKTYAQTVAAWVARIRLGGTYTPGALAIPGMKQVTPAQVGLKAIPKGANVGEAIAKLPFALAPARDRFGAAMLYENGDMEHKIVGSVAFFINLSRPAKEGRWRFAAFLSPAQFEACDLEVTAEREAAIAQATKTLTEALMQRMTKSPTPLTEAEGAALRDYVEDVLKTALRSHR